MHQYAQLINVLHFRYGLYVHFQLVDSCNDDQGAYNYPASAETLRRVSTRGYRLRRPDQQCSVDCVVRKFDANILDQIIIIIHDIARDCYRAASFDYFRKRLIDANNRL